MIFSVLSSGSKANCTFIEACNTRILIDCGLSASAVERRLLELGINPSSIQAILITHEHSDHIKGLSVFSRRHKVPVYANRATARHLRSVYTIEKIVTAESFWVGAIKIESFSISHDAADPVGFVLSAEGLKLSHVTDLGRVTPIVEEAINGSNALVLESNHDQEMLRTCRYPDDLKDRIASSHGHLSNDTAAALLAKVAHAGLLHVILAHISENSNTPDLAFECASRYLTRFVPRTLRCGSAYHSTPIIDVDNLTQLGRNRLSAFS